MSEIQFIDLNNGLYASRRYTTEYTNIPDGQQSKAVQAQLTALLSVAGEEFDPANNAVTVRSKGGLFERTYTPSIYQKDGVAVVKYGTKVIPLAAFVAGKADLSIVEKGNDKQKDYFVRIFVEPAAYPDGLAIDLRLMVIDFTKPPSSLVLANALKKDRLPEHLQEAKFGGNTFKLTELPLGKYAIVGYGSSEGKFGLSYRMDLANNPAYGEFAGKQVFANANIESVLGLKPTITVAAPAELEILDIVKGKNDKLRAECALIVDPSAFAEADSDFNAA